MNQDGTINHESCANYFKSMRAAGYETMLQGSAQGGVDIADDASINLNKRSGLPEAAVREAIANGASDYRLGIAALLGRLADSQGVINHRDAQNRMKVANDIDEAPGENPASPKPE